MQLRLESEVYAEDDLPRGRISTGIVTHTVVVSGGSGLRIAAGIGRDGEEVVERYEEAEVADESLLGEVCGQRVSDYSRISSNMITRIRGNEFILLTQQKTDKKVYIPLDRRVRLILDKYGGSLPRVSANEMNRLIKTVGLLLGWTGDCGFDARRLNPRRGRRFCDMLLSHTARRSFATNAYKAGVPLASIQAITGHSSEAQLRRYLKLDAEEKAILALKAFKGVIEM